MRVVNSILILLTLLTFAGCKSGKGGEIEHKQPIPPRKEQKAASGPEQPSMLESSIGALQRAVDQAEKTGNALDKLIAQRDLAIAEAAKLRADAAAKDGEVAALNEGIAAERTNRHRERLYWFAGLLGFLAVVAGGVAIFVPAIAKRALLASLACLGTAALAWGMAWLLPYLLPIGLGLGALALLGGCILWARDRKGLRQVVAAVEPIKEQLGDYKTHFRQWIDSDVDRHLDRVRASLGAIPKP